MIKRKEEGKWERVRVRETVRREGGREGGREERKGFHAKRGENVHMEIKSLGISRPVRLICFHSPTRLEHAFSRI